MGKNLRVLLASVLLGVATATGATIINFSYTGVVSCLPDTCTDQLSGSFAFANSPLSVGLADLTAFNLTFTATDITLPETDTWTYALTDLQSFSATFDAAQTLLSLSFKTNEVTGTSSTPNSILEPLSVLFTSTAPPSATLQTCGVVSKVGNEVCFDSSTGSLSTSVPEPSILPLLAIGLGMAGIGYTGIAFERLKRRRRLHEPGTKLI